jgi:hypothetical protein
LALGAASSLIAHPARAQEPVPPVRVEEPVPPAAQPPTQPTPPVVTPPITPQPAPAVAPRTGTQTPSAREDEPVPVMVQADDQTEWRIGRMDPPRGLLEWHGGLEMDVGYARYSFDPGVSAKEEFFDFRGRFVFGPLLNYSFGADYFVRARGEAVVWVREALGVYQVNVDDVYFQVGKRGLFDFKVGRFRTWRVYHKGLGFDLYTLEDTGALEKGPFENQQFGPYVYEVGYIYQRETPGRAAFHLYPSKWSGIELAGVYGKDGTSNTLGFRGAALVHWSFLRVTGAGEYRFYRPAVEQTSMDANGNMVTCDLCGVTKKYGVGGGAEAFIKPAGLMLGGNFAQGWQQVYSPVNGTFDKNSATTTRSLGGYLEFDLGSLVMNRSLIFGGGFNRTEVLAQNNDFRRHDQTAAYVMFPLGFNDAYVKLVGSYANLDTELANAAPHTSNMFAGRVRAAYPF